MLKFVWIWMLVLLPLPILVRWLVPRSDQILPSLRAPFFHEVTSNGMTADSPSRGSIVLAAVLWAALVAASARPVWIHDSFEVPISGRDILIALDASGSMDQQDFSQSRHSRFDVVRRIAGEFVLRRKGDRVGLILFGDIPYLYAPLTFDVDTVHEFLSTSRTRFAGARTAIGDSIGLAVKVLRERPAENRILILLTDGENSAGSIEPLQAMRLAMDHGIRIYTIAIGALPQTPSAATGPAGGVLGAIAAGTGGTYFHASNSRDLERIYHEIDRFEPIEDESARRVIAKELYHWPLMLSLLSLLMLVFWNSVSLRLSDYTRREVSDVISD
ncbi:MAG: VWA domain-containing protein [Acidiferrobacterales bacterium]|nr:VWA domain-containing protein [Acidiferrobacterales bacterium]